MNSMRRLSTIVILALLSFAMWSSIAHSRNESNGRRSQNSNAQPSSKPPATSQTTNGKSEITADAEKVVRDLYARLMRYQSAAADEDAATNGIEATPDLYLTFDIRDIHTGPIQEIYAKQLADVLTPKTGDVLIVKPKHVTRATDLPHASYAAEWSVPPTAQVSKSKASTVATMISQSGSRLADVTQYTSYEITIHLKGKQRTYRALVLYHASSVGKAAYQTEQARSARLAGIEVFDNVTSELNTVLKDESPRLRSPWAKYSKSTLYAAVMRTINTTKQAGKALISADAPIGYLPGDDVTASTVSTIDNQMTMATSDPCAPPLTVDIVDVLGTKFTGTTQTALLDANSHLLAKTSDDGSGGYQWSVGGGNDYQLTNSTLTDSSIVVRWTKEGTYDVSVTYRQQVQAAFKVTVVRPILDSLSATEATPQVNNAPTQCGEGTTSLSLACGNSVANSGIIFNATAKVPKKFISSGGKIKWVQIANSSSSRTSLAGGAPQCRKSGSNWMLDGSDPYASSGTVNNLPVISDFNYSEGTASIALDDSPFNSVSGYSPFVRADSYKIYVVYFTEDDHGNARIQRVIGVLEWSWKGEADYNSATQTYSLKAGSYSPTQSTSITGTAVSTTVPSINDLQPYSGKIQDLQWGACQ